MEGEFRGNLEGRSIGLSQDFIENDSKPIYPDIRKRLFPIIIQQMKKGL